MNREAAFSEAALDRYIEQARADWKNIGLAVAVVLGHELIFAHGFGLRRHGHEAKVDSNTVFQVGSTTKAFTTAALGILVDQKQVRWDDLVIDHLPDFRLRDPWLTRNLTIRDTVTHRSGIGDSYLPFVSIMNPDETVGQLRHAAAEAAFRDSYRYSNLMYAVAGQVIESASGMSWFDFLRLQLLRPLEMNRSGASAYEFWDRQYVTATFLGSAPAGCPEPDAARDGNIAMPHAWNESGAIEALPWQSYDNAAAAGSIVSSVSDMAHWLILNLNQGRFDNQQLLAGETLRELHTPQNLRADINPFPPHEATETYAMGWRRYDYRGHTLLAHGGGIIGFPAYAALLPNRKAGIVVLSNGSQAAREALGTYKLALHKAIALWVFDRLLQMPESDWSAAFLQRARAVDREVQHSEQILRRSRIESDRASLPPDTYVGDYECEDGNSERVRVCVAEGKLRLEFAGEGAYAASLEHWHGELFRMRCRAGVADVLGPQFATFSMSPFGSVVSMSALGATFRHVAGGIA